MKPSERIVLETLRKTTLAYLSNVEYSALEKAVETNGILNLTGTAATVLKSAVVKHGTSHDQGSHGNWASGGGGANASGGESKNQSRGFESNMVLRGQKAIEQHGYKTMMNDYKRMENNWRKKLDKPFDPENEEYGDPQDLAQADFYRKYGATPMDVEYAEGFGGFQKAKSVAVGDMVSWNSSGGRARGKVVRVVRTGVVDVPETKFSIKAEEGDPAVLIRLYRDGDETDTLVGHKMSTLTKI
jgi:hypothetical protein